MQHAHADFFLQADDHRRGEIGEQFVVGPHQLVGDGHQLAEHLLGRFGDADVVAQALGHFALAVEPDEDGHGQHDLRWLAVFALDVAADQQIEFLLGGAEFDIGFESHGVVSLQQRIEQLVDGDGQIAARRERKSSRSSMRARRYWAQSRTISWLGSLPSHSLL